MPWLPWAEIWQMALAMSKETGKQVYIKGQPRFDSTSMQDLYDTSTLEIGEEDRPAEPSRPSRYTQTFQQLCDKSTQTDDPRMDKGQYNGKGKHKSKGKGQNKAVYQ